MIDFFLESEVKAEQKLVLFKKAEVVQVSVYLSSLIL